MSQSRAYSLIEAVANVVVGYGLAVATQIVIFPVFGLRTSLRDDLTIGAVFSGGDRSPSRRDRMAASAMPRTVNALDYGSDQKSTFEVAGECEK